MTHLSNIAVAERLMGEIGKCFRKNFIYANPRQIRLDWLSLKKIRKKRKIPREIALGLAIFRM